MRRIRIVVRVAQVREAEVGKTNGLGSRSRLDAKNLVRRGSGVAPSGVLQQTVVRAFKHRTLRSPPAMPTPARLCHENRPTALSRCGGDLITWLRLTGSASRALAILPWWLCQKAVCCESTTRRGTPR